MWNLTEKKMIQMNLFTKQTHRFQKQTYGYQREMQGVGGAVEELGINIHTLLYIKQIINNDLLYGTGSSTKYSVINYMEKNLKKNKCVYLLYT